ncbi:MAG: D-alanyl-D-alanine carboxypeptidase [Clostridia bacterium]|nr:D-alanyl-D-alanine carboxypeptidase [Clostridia bacterium]
MATENSKKNNNSAPSGSMRLKYVALALSVLILTLLIAKCAVVGNNSKTPDNTADSGTDSATVTAEPVYVPPDYAKLCEGISSRLTSPTLFVYDLETGEFVFRKGTDKTLLPASITCVWTALYALTVIDRDEVITITEEALSVVPSGTVRANIYKGQKLKMSMLVEGMIVASGCDCAYVVAVEAGRRISLDSGSELSPDEAVNRFMMGLNEWTRKAGCQGTVLSEPYGISTEDHYTTANDLVLIADYALKSPAIADCVGIYSERVRYYSGQSTTWTNKNQILNESSEYYSPLATGIKTGSISGQNSLLASFSLAEGEKSRFVVGAFGASDSSARFADTKLIIDTFASAQKK